MPELTSEARKAARASFAIADAFSGSRGAANADCTSALQGFSSLRVQWFSNAVVYSPSRNRAISLVPPTTRQSIAAVRPVFARYQSVKPCAYS